jgi:hypothetical protein
MPFYEWIFICNKRNENKNSNVKFDWSFSYCRISFDGEEKSNSIIKVCYYLDMIFLEVSVLHSELSRVDEEQLKILSSKKSRKGDDFDGKEEDRDLDGNNDEDDDDDDEVEDEGERGNEDGGEADVGETRKEEDDEVNKKRENKVKGSKSVCIDINVHYLEDYLKGDEEENEDLLFPHETDSGEDVEIEMEKGGIELEEEMQFLFPTAKNLSSTFHSREKVKCNDFLQPKSSRPALGDISSNILPKRKLQTQMIV